MTLSTSEFHINSVRIPVTGMQLHRNLSTMKLYHLFTVAAFGFAKLVHGQYGANYNAINNQILALQSTYQQVATQIQSALNANAGYLTADQSAAYMTQLAAWQNAYATAIQGLQQQVQTLNSYGWL